MQEKRLITCKNGLKNPTQENIEFRKFRKTVKLALRRTQRKNHDKKMEDSSSKKMEMKK